MPTPTEFTPATTNSQPQTQPLVETPVLAAPIEKVRPLEEIEKEYILAALAFNQGNQTRTARELRIGTTTLYRKLKAYGLSKPRNPVH